MREGQFTTVAGGITFHVRERLNNGALLGIFVQDARAKDQTLTYIAETRPDRRICESGTFLILEKGSVQRQMGGESSDASIVVFERYAFDLSQLVDEPDVTTFKPRERYTGELFNPDPTDPNYRGGARTIQGRARRSLGRSFVSGGVHVRCVGSVGPGEDDAAKPRRRHRHRRRRDHRGARRGICGARPWPHARPSAPSLAFASPILVSLASLALIFGWARPRCQAVTRRWGADSPSACHSSAGPKA